MLAYLLFAVYGFIVARRGAVLRSSKTLSPMVMLAVLVAGLSVVITGQMNNYSLAFQSQPGRMTQAILYDVAFIVALCATIWLAGFIVGSFFRTKKAAE